MAIAPSIQQVFRSLKHGRWYLGRMSDSGKDMLVGLTALAGGGQTGATQLGGGMAVVDIVASSADSVKLPGAELDRVILVVNNGANAMQVFTKETSGVTIDGTAGSTGISMNAGTMKFFACVAVGKWMSK